MFRVYVMGATLLFSLLITRPPQLDILLSYLVILGRGAQSVIANRNTWRSNYTDKYEGVRQ